MFRHKRRKVYLRLLALVLGIPAAFVLIYAWAYLGYCRQGVLQVQEGKSDRLVLCDGRSIVLDESEVLKFYEPAWKVELLLRKRGPLDKAGSFPRRNDWMSHQGRMSLEKGRKAAALYVGELPAEASCFFGKNSSNSKDDHIDNTVEFDLPKAAWDLWRPKLLVKFKPYSQWNGGVSETPNSVVVDHGASNRFTRITYRNGRVAVNYSVDD